MKMIERYHSQKTPNLLHGRWWNQIYNGFHLFRISPFRLLFFHLTIGFLEARILDPQWEVFCLSLPRLASQGLEGLDVTPLEGTSTLTCWDGPVCASTIFKFCDFVDTAKGTVVGERIETLSGSCLVERTDLAGAGD